MENNGLHIAIIPDGNRRWASQKALQPWKGHEKSAKTFEELIDWCKEDGRIAVLTIWVFSTENWKRDPEEVLKLMDMFVKYLEEESEGFIKNNTRFLHSGRKDRITPELKALLEKTEENTKDCNAFTLHVALDYGGKDEIRRAAQSIGQCADTTEEDIRAHLDQPELQDIDIIIRTSGEHRTSNFFLWQSAYAEWIFSEKLFPDFTT